MGILERIENSLNFRIREKGYKITIEKQKNKIEEIKKNYEEKIEILEKQQNKFLKTIESLKDQKNTAISNRTFLVDFLKMNAFSIERILKEEREETVIGYFDKDNDVKEWFLECSSITHENLCDLFKKQVLLKEITYKKLP